MMLTLIPQWGRPEMPWSVDGEVLTIGDTPHDFSVVPDGGEATVALDPGDDHRFLGPIRRVDGVLHLTAIYHLDDTAVDPQPNAPWVLDVTDGAVDPPVVRHPEPEPEVGE
jgi:hypothetical protein